MSEDVQDSSSLTASFQQGPAETRTAAERPGLIVIYPRVSVEAPQVFRVEGTTVLGRGPDAGARLDDQHVSRSHLELRSASGGLLLRDLGSRHGSTLIGQPVGREGTLAPYGAILRCGNTLLLVAEDIERYRTPTRRIDGALLGLPRSLIAGPLLSEAWDQAGRAAQLGYPVLVLGESGSGKEGIARLVCRALGADCPFVGLNVAAVPEALFESELFGHERGSFTGASGARVGAFREADGGVLFLDEIAELRLDLQAKLLRVLDQQSVRPVGSNRDVPVRVQVVAATSQDLEHACELQKFRSDLYYRLRGVTISVPALRERPDEVLLLALAMLAEEAPTLRLSADAAERLALGVWEGNVRTLRFAMVHAIGEALASGSTKVSSAHLPALLARELEGQPLSMLRIEAAMAATQGVASRAAEMLGVSRTTFYNACKRLGIEATSLRSDAGTRASNNR